MQQRLQDGLQEKVYVLGLICLLVFQSFAAALPSAIFAAGGEDKTGVFERANEEGGFLLEVTQKDEEGMDQVIDPANGKINGQLPFMIKSNRTIKVPVAGDGLDEGQRINQGDTVLLAKGTHFPKVNLTEFSSEIKATIPGDGELKLGTARFSSEGVELTFDGDARFFNGTASSVTFNFEAEATADMSDVDFGKTMTSGIFGTEYTFKKPELEVTYNMELDANSQYDNVGRDLYFLAFNWTHNEDFRNGYVTWTAKVSKTDKYDEDYLLSLAGYTFENDLDREWAVAKGQTDSEIGKYVEGSFTVDGETKIPTIIPNQDGQGKISYTFPENTEAKEVTISYKTWIPKEKYYANFSGSIGTGYPRGLIMLNQVELKNKDENDELVVKGQSNKKNITFGPNWISNSVNINKRADYDGQLTATWEVIVNRYNKTGLKNFEIHNFWSLDNKGTNITAGTPEGLSIHGATYQVWDGSKWGEEIAITESNNKFSFSEVNSQIKLNLTMNLDDAEMNSYFNYYPRANWTIDGNEYQNNDLAEFGVARDTYVGDANYNTSVYFPAAITVGAHAYAKAGEFISNQAKLKWTVNINPQYAEPGMVVYDLIVHGDTHLQGKLENVTVKDAQGQTVNDEFINEAIAKYNTSSHGKMVDQEFITGSFVSAQANENPLNLTVYDIEKDGKRVAQLLKVTGYDTDQLASFTFETKNLNPAKFAGHVNYQLANRAHVFIESNNNGEKLSKHITPIEQEIGHYVRMLNKGISFAYTPQDANGNNYNNANPENINNYVETDNNRDLTLAGYDQGKKEAVFRLAVNHPGLDTDTLAQLGGNHVASNIKLIDTLPEGWEFIPFDDGKDFKLYAGTAAAGPSNANAVRINAGAEIVPDDEKHVVSFTKEDNVGTFNFEKLASPYVLFVKAKPSDEILEQYYEEGIAENKVEHEVFNKAELSMTWGENEPQVFTEERKVIVPVKGINKSVTKPYAGVLEWTVDYTPPFNVEGEGVYLEDTLGPGMRLRTDIDADDNEVLSLRSPDIIVYKGDLKPNGQLEFGEIVDLYDENSEVKVSYEVVNDETKLKFALEDPSQLYKIVYQTEVTAKPEDGNATNSIRLVGENGQTIDNIEATSQIGVGENDVGGGAGRNGILDIVKKDPDDEPLNGVCFALYEADGVTPVKDNSSNDIKGETTNQGNLRFTIPNAGFYILKQTCIDEDKYLPTEKEYPVRVGDTPTKPIWVDGVGVDGDNPLIVPTPIAGQLTITNEVGGNAGDLNKEFTYTITFDDEGKDGTYKSKKGDTTGEIKNGDTFTLKHGESINFPVLPKDLAYTITQKEYTEDGYTTNPDTFIHTGTIEGNGDHKANYVNTRNVGDVKVSNEVVSLVATDEAKEFTYTVTFDGNAPEAGYRYDKSDGTTGTIKSGETFTLTHEEHITIKGLLKGVSYKVVQTDYTNEYFTTEPASFTYEGAIENIEEPAHLKYVNTKEYYTFTFVSNGGSEVPPVKGIEKNKKVTEPESPTKEHYDFAGWYKDENLTELWDFNTKITKDTTVYAKWTPKKYTVTYDKNGGDTDASPQTKTVTYNGSVEEFPSTPPTREGYTFKGWGTTKDKTEANFTTDTPITEDITVYAIWKKLPAAIKGIVTDNTKNRNPIKDAKVIVTKKLKDETQFRYEYTTTEDGNYEIFIPEEGNYDVEIIKLVELNGEKIPVSFKQKVSVGEGNLNKDEIVPADKTFTGVILTKDKEHKQRLEKSGGVTIKQLEDNTIDENGASASVDESGVFTIENLTPGVPYEFAIVKEITVNGKTVELAMGKMMVTLDQDGEIAIHEQLIDPYGIITDAKTGEIIEGAKVELYYADTPRNRAKGLTPNQLVPQDDLGGIFDFAPNDNRNYQMSTGTAEWSDEAQGFGNYAWMVPAEADYYIIATKEGYEDYDSRNDVRESTDYIIINGNYYITVDYDIVNHNFKMKSTETSVYPGGPEEPTKPIETENPGKKPIEQEDLVDIPVDLIDPTKPTVKVDGSSDGNKEGKLPSTATSMYNYIYAGFILLIIGCMIAMKFRRKKEQ